MEINPEIYPLLPEKLVPWFEENQRDLPWRNAPSPYRVWISEIMLQQTRIEAVKPYFERFLTALPDIPALAAAPEETVLKLWEGLGYYSRARNLHKAAKMIVSEYDGEIPADFGKISAIPGIGPYTAGAIASIAFGLPCAAVDGNVLRVITRIAGSKADIMKQSLRKEVTDGLNRIYPEDKASAFTQSLMELGELICIPNGAPDCGNCPCKKFCAACREKTWNEIPYKAPKKERRTEKKTILILTCGNKLALRKRPDSGLLASLWELPSLEGWKTKKDAEKILNLKLKEGPEGKHVFSHLEWHMISYCGECREEIKNYIWFEREKLPAVPTAFRLFLKTEQ